MEDRNAKKFQVTEDLLAKPGKRFLNFAIDTLMVSIILFVLLVVYIANSAFTPNEAKAFLDRFMTNSLWQFTVTSSIILLYYNFFEILTSRTIGKFCTSTIVVDENGDRAGYEAVMIRSLIRAIPLYWVTFIISPTRGLHDVISKTYVVDKTLLEEKKRSHKNL